jgi:hypothetical protein
MEDFRLIPPDHNYYVYALIDPRNNEIFYIGKGKNQRYNDHKIDDPRDGNREKKNKIKEIKLSGNKVRIVKLLEYINEETAFKIEEILIYNIGRKAFNEGTLTNFNKGGNYSLDHSLFYEKELDTNILKDYKDDFNTDFKKCLIKQSQITFLSKLKFKIYEYNFKGTLIKISDSLNFFKSSIYYNLFNHFLVNDIPLTFFNRIFSKKSIDNFHSSKYNVFVDYCPYDPVFFNLLDKKLAKRQPFKLEYKSENKFTLWATQNNNDLVIGSKINNIMEVYDVLNVYNLNTISKIKDYKIESSNVQNSTLTDEEKIERDKASDDWEKFKGRLQK